MTVARLSELIAEEVYDIPIGHGRKFTLPRSYTPTSLHTAHHIPSGWIEVHGYIPRHWIRCNNKHEIAVGDLKDKVEKLWQLHQHHAGAHPGPIIKGFWEVEEAPAGPRINFVVADGSHRFYAACMRAIDPVLVRWNWPADQL